MTKKMLIDATHHEETRVAIVEGERLEEFDYESTYRKALKGSIFLAKVTRVEPSLQAAFVNFGGNRHGFLPFSEIHPDYFRIPIADREALIAEQEEEMKELEDADEEDAEGSDVSGADAEVIGASEDTVEEVESDNGVIELIPDSEVEEEHDEIESIGNRKEVEPDEADDVDGNGEAGDSQDENDGNRGRGGRNQRGRGRGGRNNQRGRGRSNVPSSNSQRVESFGGDDMDDEQRFRFKMRRKYKIQEVIKRGQIMLVQVSKEERGNKGAAVGSYLSLPGRYCVLMPNSPRAGGISRKISNYQDRAKMRELLKDLEVPKGMSVILRTAGVTRTKAEIKRDLEYLTRLWNNIRELTLESSAPAAVYEEANLVKRAVRDLYTRDVEEIIVSGEESYKIARDFMKMMIPSHVKKVKEYKDDKASLFQRYGIEKQISEIGETTVTLKSGGYLVINPTEALVSIDVNSGKATKERHIEETALKTNLEAAEEVGRQLRLRDLGGLVVIDFIDMEDRRNNAKVERRMRDALAGDRARIQMGRISSFGLMEMSRQRMNPSLNESQFETCSHCAGTGRTRTADAASIMLLRAIEEEAVRGRAAQVIVHVSNAVALYLLNQKRAHLTEIEARYEMSILIRVDDDMGAAGFRIEVSKPVDQAEKSDVQTSEPASRYETSPRKEQSQDDEDEEGRSSRRRGRRGGRRRGGRNKSEDDQNQGSSEEVSVEGSDSDQAIADKNNKQHVEVKGDDSKSDEKPVKKAAAAKKKEPRKQQDEHVASSVAEVPKADSKEEKPKAPSKAKKPAPSNDDAPKDEKPLTKPQAKKAPAKKEKAEVAAKTENAPKEYETVNATPENKKKGWWNKLTD